MEKISNTVGTLPERNVDEISHRLRSKGWEFVKVREYEETYVFRSSDGSRYLHYGDPVKIKRKAEVQSDLYNKGYPVAQVLEFKDDVALAYVSEYSLGDLTYEDIFIEGIDPESFERFCKMIGIYFDAQIKNQVPAPESFNVRKEVMAENVIYENEDLDLASIDSALDKLQHRLEKLPFAHSHGDFAARNILKNGVIDFEFHSIAPLGLDVFTACAMESFWAFKNQDGRIHAGFQFEDRHIEYLRRYLSKICEKHGLEVLPTYESDFILFKAFWSTAHEKEAAMRSGDQTKWRFRRNVLMYCIERYLKQGGISPLDFQYLAGN